MVNLRCCLLFELLLLLHVASMEHDAFAATMGLQGRTNSTSSSSSPSTRVEGHRRDGQTTALAKLATLPQQPGPVSEGSTSLYAMSSSSSGSSSNRSTMRTAQTPPPHMPNLRWVRRRRQRGARGGPQGAIGLEDVAQFGGHAAGECSTPPLPSLSLSWKEILDQLHVEGDGKSIPLLDDGNEDDEDGLDGLASLLGLESPLDASISCGGDQIAGEIDREEEEEHWPTLQHALSNEGQQPNPQQPTTKERAKTIADVEPIFLKDLPPTRVARLFEEYQVRYWQRKKEGSIETRSRFFSIGNGRNTSVGNLSSKECQEFRTYTKRFHDMLAACTVRKHRGKRANRLRRFGPKRGEQKTAQQQRETKIASAKANLTARLRQILAGEASKEWTDEHTHKMQDIVAMVKLKPWEKLVELYKKAVDLGKVPSCVDLPSD